MISFPQEFRIGRVTIAPATVLAPMAGLTDSVFRRFIRRFGGCGLIMTEFASSHGLIGTARGRKPGRTLKYLVFEPDEHPISAQLFGSDPGVMADAARVCQDLGFDILDLNLGCPVKKVVRCNGGSGLLRDLPLIGRILRAVRAAVTIPFTLKYRAGWSEREIVAVEIARMAEDCGLDAITLHPRTREQGYSGRADWTLIACVKQAVRIPVIGNGDIVTPPDAVRMVAETGCDGVMIGRAVSLNPWIFRQIAEYAAAGTWTEAGDDDRRNLLCQYYRLLMESADPEIIGKMKQFAGCFTHGMRNGAGVRARIYRARDPHEILAFMDAPEMAQQVL